ncbi:MAG: helix-turn-helix domain-containing protein [Prochlorococcus sp.]|jgi:hypothetical protein
MAASRLSDSQKHELLERYRAGETAAGLAAAYGCSPNTVTRTVKTLLPSKQYEALKASRSGRGVMTNAVSVVEQPTLKEQSDIAEQPREPNQLEQSSSKRRPLEEQAKDVLDLEQEGAGPLALDDADDFGNDCEEDSSEEGDLEVETSDDHPAEVFHEVAPLTAGVVINDHRPMVNCKPLLPGLLPGCVYMLVDKTVELDVRPLNEFPELGLLAEVDQDRQALCLFANPRSAKRQCGRSQRVIKVPDTSVFELTSSYLLARGITRLVLEGSLFALDNQAS